MFNKLKSIFGGGTKGLPEVLTGDAEQEILKNGSDQERAELAARADARPEVLYYLAEDKSVDVRRKIATNPATPVQADAILVNDIDEGVRSELARKIGRLIPSLDQSEQNDLSDKALLVLEQLAQDQLPKIRSIISEEIKKSDFVPKSIIDKLARDVVDVVCGPVLEYSPLLNEDDLREIIAAGASSGALTAIAKRENVSENVSGDIAATLDIPAISALLTNENAYIREETLDQIIDQAKSVDDLHEPLALRPQLSIRAMKRIAGFVASALVHAMMEQSDLEEEQAEDLLDRVRDRLQEEKVGDEEEATLAAKALDFAERGLIDDDLLIKEVEANHREFVIQCLAVISELPAATVRKIIHSKSGRAITALSWKAKLTMRTGYFLQTKFALVPTTQLLSAKDGKDYPLDEDELDWHLSYFIDQDG
jgi:uncharacterized protein (DUF2336 family)